jgi:plasmid stabilization system protein ParE
MKTVVRSAAYLLDLEDIDRHIARSNPAAATVLSDRIDDQVELLADPNFPRRRGRVPGTFELVAHKHYVVIFEETATTVTAMNIIHSSRRYP